MRDLLLWAGVVLRTSNMKIPRRRLADYVKKCTKKRAARAALLFFPFSQSNISFVALSLLLPSSFLKLHKMRWGAAVVLTRQIRDFQHARRQQQWQHHKYLIWLVQWWKTSVLHVRYVHIRTITCRLLQNNNVKLPDSRFWRRTMSTKKKKILYSLYLFQLRSPWSNCSVLCQHCQQNGIIAK